MSLSYCFKSLLGYIRTDLSVYKGTHVQSFFENGTLHVYICYTCLKSLLHERSMDGFSPMADAKAKGDFVDSSVKPQQRLVA